MTPRSHIGNPELLHLGPVAHAAVDDHARTLQPLEVGHHHVAEYSRGHVAAGINDDDVAFLGLVEHVPVQLLFDIGVFAFLEQILALGHHLQRHAGPGDHRAGHSRDWAHHVAVADAHMRERRAGSCGADLANLLDQVLGGAFDLGDIHVQFLLRPCAPK